MKPFQSYLQLCCFLLLLSCSKAQETISFPPLEFKCNPDLIDSVRSIDLHSLSFATPKGFIALPDSVIKQVQASLQDKKEDDLPQFLPEYAYINPEDPSSIIFVSSIGIDSAATETFIEFIRRYDTNYQSFFPGSETSTFLVNDIRCWQGRRIGLNSVHFRLLLDRGTYSLPYQIDFTFPIKIDTDIGRIIESVIGSIQNKK